VDDILLFAMTKPNARVAPPAMAFWQRSLTVASTQAQRSGEEGIPFLGFHVYPDHHVEAPRSIHAWRICISPARDILNQIRACHWRL